MGRGHVRDRTGCQSDQRPRARRHDGRPWNRVTWIKPQTTGTNTTMTLGRQRRPHGRERHVLSLGASESDQLIPVFLRSSLCTIALPPDDYEPAEAELHDEVEMPGLTLDQVRKRLLRPFRVVRPQDKS